MSAPTKKIARHEDMENGDDSSDSEYDSDPAEEGYTGGEEIQVTFEGRIPSDPDFHGIKQLLKQLFLKAHINLSELTEILIGQSNIGSVVKQSTADEDMDDEDDESDVNDVFVKQSTADEDMDDEDDESDVNDVFVKQSTADEDMDDEDDESDVNDVFVSIILIVESNIGSVVKQSTADEDMDDEDDESDVNDVFVNIGSVVKQSTADEDMDDEDDESDVNDVFVKQSTADEDMDDEDDESDVNDVFVKQSTADEDMDDEDDESDVNDVFADEDMDDEDDESDVNDVFGITTVVNITNKKHVECVQQLRQLLTELAEEHADDRIKAFVQKLLSNDSQNVGLLINERFVNIPPQISVPLLQGLSKEIQSAKDKKLAYDFQYYILISKLYKSDPTSKKKKNKKTGQPEPDILFSNAEEEVFDEEADLKFEFSVKNDSDSGMVGGWMEDDATMTPYRRVLIISAGKMDTIITKINAFVN
ncbi:hypothetical protein WDU94_001937 [Cyamophila willieti]